MRAPQERWTCSASDCDLYWVNTYTARMPELAMFDSTKSMMRYRPPNGTAGFARSRVSGESREPLPPAMIKARYRRCPSMLCVIARPLYRPDDEMGLGL